MSDKERVGDEKSIPKAPKNITYLKQQKKKFKKFHH